MGEAPVSDEVLAEAFVYASTESTYKFAWLNRGNIVLEDEISAKVKPNQLFATSTLSKLMTLEQISEIANPKKPQQLSNPQLAAEAMSFHLKDWLKNVISKGKDILEEIAKKIKEIVTKKIAEVRDILSRIRKFVMRWIISNSALPSVTISDEAISKTVYMNKITTSGSLEFGRIDKDLLSIGNLIGILKIIPSIKIQVDVQYDGNQSAGLASKNPYSKDTKSANKKGKNKAIVS